MTLADGTGFILNVLVNLIKNITTMYLTLLIKQGEIMKTADRIKEILALWDAQKAIQNTSQNLRLALQKELNVDYEGFKLLVDKVIGE